MLGHQAARCSMQKSKDPSHKLLLAFGDKYHAYQICSSSRGNSCRFWILGPTYLCDWHRRWLRACHHSPPHAIRTFRQHHSNVLRARARPAVQCSAATSAHTRPACRRPSAAWSSQHQLADDEEQFAVLIGFSDLLTGPRTCGLKI